MNFIFVSMLLTLSAGVWSEPVKVHYSLEEAETHFENFITKHGKVYKSEEEKLIRLEIFMNNLLEINKKNADPDDTAYYGITRFTDMTHTEFQASVSCLKFSIEDSQSNCSKTTLASSNFSQAPDEFDWRDKNKVSEVKNQGGCGSCWAFSTTGNLESQYAIKHDEMVLFSEQQLVDCATECIGCGGCKGINYPFEYVLNNGLMTEKDYPYEAKDEKCREQKDKSAINVTGCTSYDLKDEEELKKLLYNKGPISIAVSTTNWHDYEKGVLKNCDGPLNHAVLLVGYGTENGTPFWIVKNSWGTDEFGEKGYIRILRGNNTCGLMNPHMTTAEVA